MTGKAKAEAERLAAMRAQLLKQAEEKGEGQASRVCVFVGVCVCVGGGAFAGDGHTRVSPWLGMGDYLSQQQQQLQTPGARLL